MKIAIFPGSFDPFTIGHADIVSRALPLFDKLIIAVGINAEKKYLFDKEVRIQRIADAYANNAHVEVKTYDTLTIEFAKQHNARYIIRGIRSVQDFEYERQMSDANFAIGGIETILLYSKPEYSFISSSFVRDLYTHGVDVSRLIV